MFPYLLPLLPQCREAPRRVLYEHLYSTEILFYSVVPNHSDSQTSPWNKTLDNTTLWWGITRLPSGGDLITIASSLHFIDEWADNQKGYEFPKTTQSCFIRAWGDPRSPAIKSRTLPFPFHAALSWETDLMSPKCWGSEAWPVILQWPLEPWQTWLSSRDGERQGTAVR